MTKILGINRHHDAAAALLEDGEVKYFVNEERLNRFKHEGIPYISILKAKDYIDSLDNLVIGGFQQPTTFEYEVGGSNSSLYQLIVARTLNLKKDFTVNSLWDKHHLTHAAGAFYNSGFKDALSFVFDGAGSLNPDDANSAEASSCFYFTYPSNYTTIFKIFANRLYGNKKDFDFKNSLGYFYHKVTFHLGLGDEFSSHFNAGKTMGLSSYGKRLEIEWDKFFEGDNKLYDLSKNMKDFKTAANIAHTLQCDTQDIVLNKINEVVRKTNVKNVCVSGGYILNCINNFNLVKNLPKNINLYVEPISADNGSALGAAKLIHHHINKDYTIRPQKSLYYGFKYNNVEHKIKSCKTRKVTKLDVANLLQNEVVAIWQGKSEQGPRALGNRSILFNPKLDNGKDIVNRIKKREWFRPFAGTILYEYTKDYFDMAGLDESPFMTYAVDVKKEKIKEIPAITHIDNTCRVQTLKKEFNIHYYELIEEFFKITGTPILLNTSFNLAGDPMVETIDDALDTLNKSELKYIYLPELNTLIEK